MEKVNGLLAEIEEYLVKEKVSFRKQEKVYKTLKKLVLDGYSDEVEYIKGNNSTGALELNTLFKKNFKTPIEEALNYVASTWKKSLPKTEKSQKVLKRVSEMEQGSRVEEVLALFDSEWSKIKKYDCWDGILAMSVFCCHVLLDSQITNIYEISKKLAFGKQKFNGTKEKQRFLRLGGNLCVLAANFGIEFIALFGNFFTKSQLYDVTFNGYEIFETDLIADELLQAIKHSKKISPFIECIAPLEKCLLPSILKSLRAPLHPTKIENFIFFQEKIIIGKIDVTLADANCLKPKAWINDIVINAYIVLLLEEKQSCLISNSFFLINLKNGSSNWHYLETIEWFLTPCFHENHWQLIVTNLFEKKIICICSMHTNNNFFLVDYINYLNEQQKKIDNWEIIHYNEFPKQTNTYDCGVFLLIFLRIFSSNSYRLNVLESFNKLSKYGMDFFRRQVFYELWNKMIVEIVL